MNAAIGRPLQLLSSLPNTFTTGQARQALLAPRDLYRLRERGIVIELTRGVYRKADAPETIHVDLLAVAKRSPQAIVCLVSAMALHELTDDVPAVIQIAVPRGTHRPRITYPPTEVAEFAKDTFELGLTHFEVAQGESVRVYDAARTVVDGMRLRHIVGDTLAFHALREYADRRGASLSRLSEYAQALNVDGPVRQAILAVTS